MEKPAPAAALSEHQLAMHYLKHRTNRNRKGTPPVVYLEEVKIVLEMLEAGRFREWYRAMVNVLPGFPAPQ